MDGFGGSLRLRTASPLASAASRYSIRAKRREPAVSSNEKISLQGMTANISVIMDVMNAEQAKIAEEAGACAVMALGKSKHPSGVRWKRAQGFESQTWKQ